MIRCPECELSQDEGLEVVKVQEERVRVTYATDLLPSNGVLNVLDCNEVERETLDTFRDEAEYRCDDCGFSTDDPDDFLDTEDESG